MINTIIKYAFALALIAFIAFNGYGILRSKFIEKHPFKETKEVVSKKESGTFFMGLYAPEIDSPSDTSVISDFESKLDHPVNIVSIYLNWGLESTEQFPDSILRAIRRKGALPLITWEPWTYTFPEFLNNEDLRNNQKLFKYILNGTFDDFLSSFASKIRDFNQPVMLRFAHEMDNPAYGWSTSGQNSASDFIEGWRYVVQFFNKEGCSNVTWVWNPWEDSNIDEYYPGDDYVDWIGVTGLNYGYAASNGKWYDFKDLYQPFSDAFRKYNKPVIISEFGCTTFGGIVSNWYQNAMKDIKLLFPEIKGLVFFYSAVDKNWGYTDWRPKDGSQHIDWTFDHDINVSNVLKSAFNDIHYSSCLFKKNTDNIDSNSMPLSVSIQHRKGRFDLFVNDHNYYIKGVAYNPGHEWRDGDYPLTRQQIDKDMQRLKEMGANTIRRYGVSNKDELILNTAHKYGIKVLFGFWFEQGLDYYGDQQKIAEYEKIVMQTVQQYKDHPAILAWCLGNEVWGLLKHHYTAPYLSFNRSGYLKFIEKTTQEVKRIDSKHPVFVALEHSQHLAGALHELAHFAPSVDVAGVNVYYDQSLITLDSVMQRFYIGKPYFISEFGPDGYWDDYLNRYDQHGLLIEKEGLKKAAQYEDRWDSYVEKFRGNNLGGIAYCWKDRYEGSATWFGITDMNDNLKPPYFSLQNAWTNKNNNYPVRQVYIFTPELPYHSGESYTFYGIYYDMNNKKMNYEWMICSAGLDYCGSQFFEIKDQGKKILATFPDENQDYRIYLSVTDREGRTNTASIPVRIYQQQLLN